ncbi:MAG TPA: YjbE family putative metal transport protein [Usitatibacter sp.]|nr:YjbE family putative metal transport protein [Usitatibacter sp.]
MAAIASPDAAARPGTHHGAMDAILSFLGSFASIVVINLMLSGDNAIVIALAARNLPARLQRRAIVFGTVGAVVVRCAMTLAVVWLLAIPGLLFAGGVALAWIGYKLLLPEEDAGAGHDAKPRGIWAAVRTIVIADMVMGGDNVLGVAGAAHGSYALVVLGLATSVPIVVWGSTWLLKWVERHPSIVYVGAAVLLWTAAKMITDEPLAEDVLARWPLTVPLYVVLVCGVLLAGFVRNHRHLESRIHARLAQLAARSAADPSASGKEKTMDNVLVPISDFATSYEALPRVAAAFRRNPELTIHLLNVRRPLSGRVVRLVRRSLRQDYYREKGAIALAPAREWLDRRQIPYQAHVLVGDAAEVIAEEAKRLRCERIVMGTARRGSITRFLELATTERVLGRTDVPVELVVGDSIPAVERYGRLAAMAIAVGAIVTMIAEM